MNSRRSKSKIASKVMIMTVASIMAVTAVFLLLYVNSKKQYDRRNGAEKNGQTVVALNEVYKLIDENQYDDAKQKLTGMMSDFQEKENTQQEMDTRYIKILYVMVIVFILILYLVIYILVLKPFGKLEGFAADIAAGNLDQDLKYNRVNMFGEFTWAFDHMRREIKKARQCEQEAVENNKTVIATLSHDIKTPIASIRAYSEALSENMDTTPERRNRYIDVITRKCDEVAKITDDMFIHSLHDLDKLVIKRENVEIDKVIKETVDSMSGGRADIVMHEIKPATIINADAGRIAQVIENIINNARKYAKSNIYIDTEIIGQDDGMTGDYRNTAVNNIEADKDLSKEYVVHIKDEGNGIPPEDMPFIFEKFYRGNNRGEEPGAGLGLFIVQYVMQQTDGRVELVNHDDGLEVLLYFPMEVK
ncbi:MAG: ATP-binding protein [Wujia sp.]